MRRKGLFIIMFLLALGIIMTGCNGNTGDTPDDKTPTTPTLSVDVTSLTLEVGETKTITPTTGNTNGTVQITFVSNDEAVATVNDNGTINAIAVGEAKITVSIKDTDVSKEVTITVVEAVPDLTLTGENTVTASQSITLIATDKDSPDNVVFWESSNTAVLTVDQNGVVTGVSGGTATVTITSYYSGKNLTKEITVIVPEPTSVEISELTNNKITLATVFKLDATVLPLGTLQEVVWSSSNDGIATVDSNGRVTPVYAGEVTITASVPNTDIVAMVTFTVEPTAMEVLTLAHRANPTIAYDVMYWGNDNPALNQVYDVYGSVSNYFFGDITIDRTSFQISPTASKYIEAGTLDSVEFIVVHDTASAGGGAKANAGWAANPTNTGTSWHYTVGNDGIYQSLPEDRVGYHAGDGVRSWTVTDTGVKATNQNPTMSISADGRWVLNGVKSTVLSPRDSSGNIVNAPLTDSGIYTEIGANGNYYIGSTYYNSGYGVIANTGGGANGIGIETAMNNGSDVYLTWHYTAKLVASLLVKYDLGVNRVHPHNFYSGKDCPRTMRNAGLWDNFVEMVKAEYLVSTLLDGYTIQFTSNNPQYVNNFGRIIDLPTTETRVSYTLKVTDKTGQVETKLFYTTLPAKQA